MSGGSALASLTAQYTDSENEGEASPDSQNSTASQVIIPRRPTPPPAAVTSKSEAVKEKRKKKRRPKKVRRLVSYQDDTLISDEEEDRAHESSEEEASPSSSSESENAEHEKQVKDKVENGSTSMDVDEEDNSGQYNADERTAESYEKDPKYAKYKFQLPPEPKGKPSPELVAKIKKMYSKMSQSNMDMNRVIQDRKEFRNPSIYEKLIQFCDINEFGTNYPPEIYDPLQWGAESYYEELSRVQKNDMLKRQKDRKDFDKVEQATALARKVEEEAKKRKSKWDQPASSAIAKPALPPALTTTVTGTKGTVISAFGSLPKKPAV